MIIISPLIKTGVILVLFTLTPTSMTNASSDANLTAVIGPICLDSTLWSLPTFDTNDCQRALENLLNSDVARWGREVFEFMVRGATSMSRYPKVSLPAAYEYGKNVQHFPPP